MEEKPTAFAEFENHTLTRRRDLLPVWIKILICLLFLFKGIVAYGLWFEQKWAPQAAIADAIIGIAVCLIMMAIIPFMYPSISFTLRLELIPLYFYLKKMQSIKTTWENL